MVVPFGLITLRNFGSPCFFWLFNDKCPPKFFRTYWSLYLFLYWRRDFRILWIENLKPLISLLVFNPPMKFVGRVSFDLPISEISGSQIFWRFAYFFLLITSGARKFPWFLLITYFYSAVISAQYMAQLILIFNWNDVLSYVLSVFFFFFFFWIWN